jgi:hypothetical protein
LCCKQQSILIALKQIVKTLYFKYCHSVYFGKKVGMPLIVRNPLFYMVINVIAYILVKMLAGPPEMADAQKLGSGVKLYY